MRQAGLQRSVARNILSPQAIALLTIALLSGVFAYGFNFAVDAYYGPESLTRILAAFGGVSTISLPAALVTLPVSTWSGQRPDWRRRLPTVQLCALAIGAASAFAVLPIRGTFAESWFWPLTLMVAFGSYLPAVNAGTLIGRNAFVSAAAIMLVPNFLRLVGVFWLGNRIDVSLVVWVQAVSFVVTALVGSALPYLTREPSAVRPVSAKAWASGWVALATTAWLATDVLAATIRLGADEAAGFAVVALLGKAPYYLAQPLVTKSVSEEGWGTRTRLTASVAVAAIAAASILVSLVAGRWMLHLMHVHVPAVLLALFFTGTSALNLSYLWTGADAQRAEHHWWPVLAASLVWVLLTLLVLHSVTAFVVAYTLLQLAASGVSLWLHLRSMRRQAMV